MKFEVRACTESEYKKANEDPTYSPEEYVVDTLNAASEYEANRLVKARIKSGKYPSGSIAIEVPPANFWAD